MWIWVWECHGNRWELIPSRLYPDRVDVKPRCPVCHTHPERKWVNVTAELAAKTKVKTNA